MTSASPRTGAGRWAGPCFVLVALVSVWVLFAPDPGAPQTGLPGADKLVHLLLFLLLALTVRWRFGSGPLLLAAVLGYAALSEVVQHRLLAERSGDPLDLLADAVGALVGWLVAARLPVPQA